MACEDPDETEREETPEPVLLLGSIRLVADPTEHSSVRDHGLHAAGIERWLDGGGALPGDTVLLVRPMTPSEKDRVE